MDLKETDILGPDIDNHWYYKAKAQAMMGLLPNVLPSTILDVGAGSGFFSKRILHATRANEAWCVDISYERDFDGSENGKPVYFRKSIDKVNADLVLLMDVLEHVDDDVSLLREYSNKVPHNAHFLISVPAFQFLWSGHDVFLDHKRRYRLKQLKGVVEQAGLTVEQGVYYFGAVFPIAATVRILKNITNRSNENVRSQLTRHNRLTNELLLGMCKAELPFLRHNKLIGLSIFVLARNNRKQTSVN